MADKSFFRLAQLSQITVDGHTLHHNLHHWNLDIYKAHRKNGDQLQLEIIVPYNEMNLDTEEKSRDPQWFGHNVARLTISKRTPARSSLLSYLVGKRIKVTISAHTEFLIFNSPYFYPHNWYYLTNKDYLYQKINRSVVSLSDFVQAYMNTFQTKVPMIYIRQAKETAHHYHLYLILKDYVTINHIKTDLNTNTLYFHVLIERSRMNEETPSQYHEIHLKIPRIGLSNSSGLYFNFSGNSI